MNNVAWDGNVSEGTLRVRFGEVEPRGFALTPKGRERCDDEMASQGLAYYRGGDPSKPVVYEDFLPVSAAGIFRSNLDADTELYEKAELR